MTKHKKGPAYAAGRGQSTVEYVLLVTAVVAVVITLAVGSNSPFQQKLTTTINATTDGMEDMANRLMSATNPSN